MFFVNECVQSCRHGMGIVVNGGPDPVVQILDGPRLRVVGRTLRIIPHHVYDAEILNRAHVERWLDWRIHGVVRPAVRLLPRHALNLAAAMNQSSTLLSFERHRTG